MGAGPGRARRAGPVPPAAPCVTSWHARILPGVVAVRSDLTALQRAGRSEVEARCACLLPTGPVEGLGRLARVVESAPVAVVLRGNASRVTAQISATFRLLCPCDRCLEPVTVPMTLDYAEDWALHPDASGPLPATGRPGGAGERDEPTAADEDTLRPVRDGALVDIADGFWQAVALTLPTKVLCRVDCRGLCPHCGADLNRQACGCRTRGFDPRMAALADWRHGGAG